MSAQKSRKPKASRARAFRLDTSLRPGDVDLHINVDPQAGKAFDGRVEFELDSDRPRRRIEIHAAELRVHRARIAFGGESLRGRIVMRPERETALIHFDRTLPAGRLRLSLSFAGTLRGDLSGLYGAEVNGARYAFTQLEPASARKFFPCFDEPAMKARFALSVTTPAANQVISNSREERVAIGDTGQKTVHFERTPLLSSYLVALAVGDLRASRVVRAGKTPIRLWFVPGFENLVDFGLLAARQSLLRLEEYFGIPYPYSKLDLVAVPDFEIGAMENAGAVFFRETLLLIDPDTVTLAEKKRAAEVICHELAHMWFGNLVTMAWWDDLWLNEAFATWMAFWIVDRWKPGWKMWHDFQHHRAPALDLDGLRNTHAIYTPVASPEEANANFDVITYEKGASVVRMLEHYIGEAAFRRGVRKYLRRHFEANASANDLWSALEAASGEGVAKVVQAWTLRPGFPLLRVKTERRGKATHASISQERFREGPARKADTLEAAWPIPWVAHVGRSGRAPSAHRRQLLTRRRQQVLLGKTAPRFLYANADEGGFFRVEHGSQEHEALLQHAGDLAVAERMGWAGHQWALVRTRRAPLARFLEVADALASDRDPDVLAALERPLAVLGRRLAPLASAEAPELFAAWIRQHFGAGFGALGFDPRPSEAGPRRLRRARLLSLAGGLGADPVLIREASRRCAAYLSDRESLCPDLADPVVGIAAASGNARLYARLRRAAERAHTPQERRRFLLALADFPGNDEIDETLERCLGDSVATQDVAFVLARAMANPAATLRTWRFLRRRWSRLLRRMPPHLAGRLIETTPLLGTKAHRKEVAEFFREHPVPSAERTLRQALERFDSWNRFKGPARRELDALLRSN